MRYISINNKLFIYNRKKFISFLDKKSLALFNSNIFINEMKFHFNLKNDLFYLSGIEKNNIILLLFPGSNDNIYREILFIERNSKKKYIWTGNNLSKIDAYKISGIKNIYWIDEFNKIFSNIITYVNKIYFSTDINIYKNNFEYKNIFIENIKKKYISHIYINSDKIFKKIRLIKAEEEICQIKKACNITEKAFQKIISIIKPGIWEYEIEAYFLYEFIKNCADGFAYKPIIAAGSNTCIIHYNYNNKICKNNDLLLMDVGASYANYNSDVTRTIPVNGKFTNFQRKVYKSLLEIKNQAENMLYSGNSWIFYKKEIINIMKYELLKLGLIKKNDLNDYKNYSNFLKKYFIHNISHNIGLNVHDYCTNTKYMQKGMVVTIEPGIYIPEKKIGIRIEDDYIIMNNKSLNLTKNIPILDDEIEDFMN